MAINILLSEDCSAVRHMISKTLEISDIPFNEIHEAKDGHEGLEILRNHQIDLILLDINMPEMDGAEMLNRVKADPDLCDIPTLVISAQSNTRRVDAFDHKNVQFLFKPFTPERLRQAVKNLLEIEDDQDKIS